MNKGSFLLATVSVLVILLASCGSLAVGAVALQKAPTMLETTKISEKEPSKKEPTPPPSSKPKAPATKPIPPPASKPSNFTTEWGGSGTKWGESGDADGQFSGPRGVATDSSGNVYVADTDNYRIQKFDPNGDFLTKWGKSGSADGQFVAPQGVAADSSDNVYVVDADTGIPAFRGTVARIQKFDSKGTFLSTWGQYGSADRQLDSPQGIAADSSGNVYVADTDNDRVQKFGSTGAFGTKWGERGYPSSEDGGDGKFYHPYGVATDSSGNVYVADNVNHRIQKFDSGGNFIKKWGERGEEDGQFMEPRGIATDSSDNVYVADDSNRIQVFDSNGRFLTKWGGYGSVNSGAEADGKFNSPSYIAIDSSDNVYVADTGNHRIQKFSPPPTRLVPPAAPSDLNVEVIGSSSIRVEWDDNSANEDGFEISNDDETSTTVDTDITTYTWTGLAPGTYTCFRVRAFNSAGNSAFTPAECATTRSTGTEDETSTTDKKGTTEETGPTSTTDTEEESDDGPVEAIEEVLPPFIPIAVEDAFEGLEEGRLPETGGGWAVLLLLGAALIGGGWSLVRLGRRFSR